MNSESNHVPPVDTEEGRSTIVGEDLPVVSGPSIAERSPWHTVTRWLIVINVLVFVLDYVVIRQSITLTIEGRPVSPPQTLIAFWGGFTYYFALAQFQVWRFVTYQFCHVNIEHILVNMLGLLLAGPIVEERLGRVKFLMFYLVCGIAGPLAHIVLTQMGLLPLGIFTPLIGASASIYGVLVAAATIAPHEIVELIFPPIDLRMRTLAFLMIGLSLAAVLLHFANAGGHAAHLGGAIVGYLFIRRLLPKKGVLLPNDSPSLNAMGSRIGETDDRETR